jgi:hypothetical protein
MLEKAYYYLTCFGRWTLYEAYENEVVLLRGTTSLFNVDKEEYFTCPKSKLKLYRNRKYSIIEGTLSYYDREILESLKFKIRNNSKTKH